MGGDEGYTIVKTMVGSKGGSQPAESFRHEVRGLHFRAANMHFSQSHTLLRERGVTRHSCPRHCLSTSTLKRKVPWKCRSTAAKPGYETRQVEHFGAISTIHSGPRVHISRLWAPGWGEEEAGCAGHFPFMCTMS